MTHPLLSGPVSGRALLAVDTETTGLRVTDRPVEVAAVRLEGGRVTATFSSLVAPEAPVPPEVTAVHGLTDADLAAAPPAAEVLPRLCELGHGAVWLAHNAGFDAGILGYACVRAGVAAPAEPLLDTCRLARACLPGHKSYGLEALGRALGLCSGGFHRALADAQVAAALFARCVAALGPPEEVPLVEVARRAGGWMSVAGVARAAREVPDGFGELQGAIAAGREVRLRYDAGGRGRPAWRRVAPKVLYRREGHVYLEAFCLEGRFVKSYRLDRVVEYDLLPPTAASPG